jgi:hypothetical protein
MALESGGMASAAVLSAGGGDDLLQPSALAAPQAMLDARKERREMEAGNSHLYIPNERAIHQVEPGWQ